ncbi:MULTISPECIES: ATP synthase subunit I [Oscillatoriales]|uniref:ATP synthase protein I n=2 Tax=Limnospira TaxID=2596745 RepID=A0A9P1KK89_9CYAN|nr:MULTISPECIES: ATP synthase subunit I [Oscillatoriales]AMW27206.1 ATP synthase subunit I [Arthrospira platensis YZ]EKD09160.1 putative ATP synthase protein I [Arthrospira platensis C1]KDR58835.1 ATP synthase subunit I [Arthrospira platensis str. Paraca]MBD2668612.1 ATP synthase subunit I [Arthrospira platensis FACHB-439]MBD2709292.1 ATP synthase subunit I [Arthrospira platensis FACHB-835]MDC0839639.1 ATP synthase subunit I [Limnoraphis robusta]MDT9309348.1 ATP synthase subunit I [Limnospir
MSDAGDTVEMGSPVQEPDSSMGEYYQLQRELLLTTIVLAVVIFLVVYWFYPWTIALNYLLGALLSVVYLRMLGKDVERIGTQKLSPSKNRLAVFAALIIVATQLNQLKILPIFLGFLTYKAALLVYTLRLLVRPNP